MTNIMAFDFGLNRIGVALGNTSLKIAHPLAQVSGKSTACKFEQIADLVSKWNPHHFVVGTPTPREDKKELINAINRFIGRLKHKFNLPVTTVVEDYTSLMAKDMLDEQGVRGIKQKASLDELAACVILNIYFNQM